MSSTGIMEEIERRRLPDGGFRGRSQGGYRPDATAWAIMALQAVQGDLGHLSSDRARLAADQQADGRVPLAPAAPQTFWPTPLAMLAWQGDPAFRPQQERAARFLLQTKGWRPWRTDTRISAHNPDLLGWPWVADTFSWVLPTSLAMLALTAGGWLREARVDEARQLLLDRQLPTGGWNYGNTIVFGRTLHPMPETTGVALTALAGRVDRAVVAASIDYLTARLERVRTPLSLGWGLLGLTAWQARPALADIWLQECWHRQEQFGPYDTEALALLLLAWTAIQGLPRAFRPPSPGSEQASVPGHKG